MSCLGNIIWLVFGGFFASIGYLIGGLGMMLTVIGIPFGIQSIKIGLANLSPFGKTVVEKDYAWSPLAIVMNVIWIILFGWGIALIHITSGIILAITIVGIPFAKQHFKLIKLALLPFGRELV